MSESIHRRFAELLAEYCEDVQPGDRMLLQVHTPAIPLVRELARSVTIRGGIPVLELAEEGYEEIFYSHASLEQVEGSVMFTRQAYETFEGRIWVRSDTNINFLDHLSGEQLADDLQRYVSGHAIQARRRRRVQARHNFVPDYWLCPRSRNEHRRF